MDFFFRIFIRLAIFVNFVSINQFCSVRVSINSRYSLIAQFCIISNGQRFSCIRSHFCCLELDSKALTTRCFIFGTRYNSIVRIFCQSFLTTLNHNTISIINQVLGGIFNIKLCKLRDIRRNRYTNLIRYSIPNIIICTFDPTVISTFLNLLVQIGFIVVNRNCCGLFIDNVIFCIRSCVCTFRKFQITVLVNFKFIGFIKIEDILRVGIRSLNKAVFTFVQIIYCKFAILSSGNCRLIFPCSCCIIIPLKFETNIFQSCGIAITTVTNSTFLYDGHTTFFGAVLRVNNNVILPLRICSFTIVICNTGHRNRNEKWCNSSRNRYRFRCLHHNIKTNIKIFEFCYTFFTINSRRFHFCPIWRHIIIILNNFLFTCSSIGSQVGIDSNRTRFTATLIIVNQIIRIHDLINRKAYPVYSFSFSGNRLSFVCCRRICLPVTSIFHQVLVNSKCTLSASVNRCHRCSSRCICTCYILCHCWHGAQAEGQGGAQQACEKTFCFFHFSTSSLKKIIIGWAAGPPGLRVLHQHGVQCGALQRGNAAAPPALCREEKRRKNWAACPLCLRLRLP